MTNILVCNKMKAEVDDNIILCDILYLDIFDQ